MGRGFEAQAAHPSPTQIWVLPGTPAFIDVSSSFAGCSPPPIVKIHDVKFLPLGPPQNQQTSFSWAPAKKNPGQASVFTSWGWGLMPKSWCNLQIKIAQLLPKTFLEPCFVGLFATIVLVLGGGALTFGGDRDVRTPVKTSKVGVFRWKTK